MLVGEALLFDGEGRPLSFQDSMSRPGNGASGLRAFFFDVLHHDGTDLIDLALAERWTALASGRRQGWLSNLHIGAAGPDGGYVMLGKTFKGLTDEMLEWQTKQFLEIEDHREGHVVYLKPEIVYEIVFDGVQRSTRYPGGVALRFARVTRYRDDKDPSDADTLETVRSYLR